MTCREAIAVLSDYLEEALGPEAGQELERHLQACDACVAYLNTFRKTRELAADSARVEFPSEMRARLRAFLLGALKKLDP